MEYAAFGWATMVWWTWPAIFVTVMAAVGAVVGIDRAVDRKADKRTAKNLPCMVHLDSERLRWETYCGDLSGHDGRHGKMIIVAHNPDPFGDTE